MSHLRPHANEDMRTIWFAFRFTFTLVNDMFNSTMYDVNVDGVHGLGSEDREGERLCSSVAPIIVEIRALCLEFGVADFDELVIKIAFAVV